MKKIYTIFSLLFMLIALNASAQDRVYLKDSNVQAGAEGKIDLCIETDKPITSINCEFTLPEGVEFVRWDADIQPTSFNPDINNVLFFNRDAYSTGVIATIVVNVGADVELGDHSMAVTMAKVVQPDLTTYTLPSIESVLTVQNTAVIEPLTDGYSLEVLPFVAKEGASTIDVLFKSAATAKSVTFDMELPQGMMFYDAEQEFAPSTPKLNASACTKTPTVSLTVTDDVNANKASVSVIGQNTGAAALRKYINQLDELTTLVSIPVYVVPADEIADWGDEYALNEGVYEAKLNNIVVTDYTSNATFTGNYIASVIVGQPAQEEAILYGHYTSDVASAFSTALKNVAIADVTVATVDAGVKFVDVLVNEKGGKSYYTRTSSNFGTTVLPLDLTTDNVAELYRIVSMDAKSIVLTEAASVSANTPCIFKGTINVEGATPTLGVPSEQGLGQTTFKGTYSATEIAAGEGYYISSNGKFYNDGASVRPFRGYFDGAIAGVKSFSVFVNTANGLVDITNQLSDEAIYSLQGIRTQTAKKGVNIVGGKKVYIK